MKRIWRAVATAVAGSTALAAAVLAPSATAQAAPLTRVPPRPSSMLAGTWVNRNAKTESLAALVISTTKASISVDGFGACTPSFCQWGKVAGTVYGPNVSATAGTAFEAQWDFKFARTVLLARLSTFRGMVPTLTVEELTTFTDGSGRANYAVTETFTKGNGPRATMTGTSAANFPLGDSRAPDASLLRTWVNPAASGTISKVILSVNPSTGQLAVQAFGYCSPVACDWGTVTGTTFGTSVSSSTASTFLAPYVFGFAGKLLEGSVNAGGTRLTVRSWTEFTDHSGRANYDTTETLVPGS
ncbi:MAG TPA: hypothetical protein VF838_13805 [Trebonia sp.]